MADVSAGELGGVTVNRAARRAAARRGRKAGALASGAVLMSGAAGLAVSALAGPAVAATTFTVDDGGDTGPTAADCTDITVGNCSLRDAIAAANVDAVEDLIVFDASVSGAITLGSDLPAITEPVDIQGPGATVLTIDGVDDYQPFFFDGVDVGTPSISGLTITDGYSNGRTIDNSGGAIGLYDSDASFAFSNLVVSSSYAANDGGGLWCVDSADVLVANSTFDENDSQSGGAGLYFRCDDLTITGSTVSYNDAGGAGGGLYFAGDALVVSGSTFTRNSTDSAGGGLHLIGATHTITNTTISLNRAIGGGGVLHGTGTLTISDSTITGNVTDGDGGGVYLNGDEALIERSTISGNEAEGSGGGFELYGAPDVTVLASTISGNTAGVNGGGFYLGGGYYDFSPDTSLTVANSTIAGNTALLNGGGIALYAGELSLLQSTVSGNTATRGLGDGLYFQGYEEPVPLRAEQRADRAAEAQARFEAKLASGEADAGDAPTPTPTQGQVNAAEAGAVTLTGTIVSANIGGEDLESGGDDPVAVTANSSLLGGVGSQINLSGAGNLTGVNDPGLAALANNGGPTQTMELTATSPALDVGPETVPTFAGNSFDQRGTGFPRVSNGRVDIGAFERQLEALFTG